MRTRAACSTLTVCGTLRPTQRIRERPRNGISQEPRCPPCRCPAMRRRPTARSACLAPGAARAMARRPSNSAISSSGKDGISGRFRFRRNGRVAVRFWWSPASCGIRKFGLTGSFWANTSAICRLRNMILRPTSRPARQPPSRSRSIPNSGMRSIRCSVLRHIPTPGFRT